MKTILVVDDEFDLASTLRAILEGEGYRVETCSNGREVLDRLKAGRPDLLLTDVMMPVLSGFEVLRVMQQTPGLGSVPVILMSAVPPGVKREEYQWQAFLLKPFTIEALLKAVEQQIGKAEAGTGGR